LLLYNFHVHILKSLKRIFSDHGVGAFSVIFSHLCEYSFFKYVKKGSFEFKGRKLPYFYHWYGHTYRTERVVEIPIALDFLATNDFRSKEVLEVGDVLRNYIPLSYEKYTIVDKYAKDSSVVINQDIVDFKSAKKFDLIISVSTVEHVGWDEEDKMTDKFKVALNHMATLLSDTGKMLVTVPFGYNSDLDKHALRNGFQKHTITVMNRISKDNRWKELPLSSVGQPTYDKPFPHGNFVLVIETNPPYSFPLF